MRLSDIEMSVPIGRTSTGSIVTVRDIMAVLATVSGTALGSRQFDEILSEPYTLHAPDTLSSSVRYGALSAMLEGVADHPDWLEIERETIRITLPPGSPPASGLNLLIDTLIGAQGKEASL